MNEMVQRLDTIQPDAHNDVPSKVLNELEAFIEIDATLASLNKQYLDAKTQRKALIALHGAEDAMAEIAIDMEDSAWCAMQTRYIELREQRDLMKQAQRLVRQSEIIVEDKKQRKKQNQAFALFQRMQILERVREQRRANIGLVEIAYILLAFKLLPNGFNKPSFQMSAVA